MQPCAVLTLQATLHAVAADHKVEAAVTHGAYWSFPLITGVATATKHPWLRCVLSLVAMDEAGEAASSDESRLYSSFFFTQI